ncbi:MAG: mechanosensitive ion channel [Rhodospirillaceae bacterium]|jgi:small-conductance mechanosensitive channel|nr:mechanosensitive ion channel [Rhodospirillaceae bacterium]MBT4589421.1 mechanosensitive ion channel [Rhodospirillaceae bacterium]MBT4938312.1 mechanosensitive ion channel [Rhodospirillaceae bacterium]MBT5941737.1 mechanosensitive ion channel [Rhodospirillaceae bacterium]MBT7266440.1 mechanosensitive ion channel [Rhodospirillaceae bacterium]
MQKLFDPQYIETQFLALRDWLFSEVLVLSSLGQLIFIALAFLVAWAARPLITKGIGKLSEINEPELWVAKLADALALMALPVVWIIVQYFSSLIAEFAGWPHHLMTVTVSLLTAWIIIRLTATLIRDKTWSKLISVTAWTIAALNITNLLDQTVAFLDSLSMDLGELHVSALTVIKGMMALAVLLWLAQMASRTLEKRVAKLPNMTPSVQVLLTKLFKIFVMTIAIVAAMNSVGIDLTGLAVFSGAVGVGIGFGMQKIFANLISGLLILADKSIKPGDVIEVAGTYGWVNTLGGRYASVITRDGVEHLIPNEELINQRVSNWTFSDTEIRLKLPIGVSYDTDLPHAIETCIKAAQAEGRIITSPKPTCLIMGFGDSSIDLELRVWIRDPHNGISNIKSAVFLQVWKLFKEEGIEIPFPQRVLHMAQDENTNEKVEALA